MALRLRELQTMTEIARERNMIVVTTAPTPELGNIMALARAAQAKGEGKT